MKSATRCPKCAQPQSQSEDLFLHTTAYVVRVNYF